MKPKLVTLLTILALAAGLVLTALPATPAIAAATAPSRIPAASISPISGACGAVISAQATLEGKINNRWTVVPNQLLTFRILDAQGVTLNTNVGVSDVNGVATTQLVLYEGGVNLRVSFAGNRSLNLKASNTTVAFTTSACVHETTLIVADAIGPFDGTTSLQATLTDALNGSPLPDMVIHFAINGVDAGVSATDSSGVATLAGASLAGIPIGHYIPGPGSGVSASYDGEELHSASSGAANLVVAQAVATLTLSDLDYVFDGTAKAATVTSEPPALETITVLYNGLPDLPVDAGEYLVTASLSNPNYEALDATGTLVIAQASQAITFDQPASPQVYGASFTVSPSAESGLPVILSAVGSCSAAGFTVTMTSGTGLCALTASQAGDENYLPATDVVRYLDAAKAPQAVTFEQPASPAQYGSSFSVSASADSGLSVTVQVQGACTLSAGVVTMTSGTGTCTLTASQSGDQNYLAAENIVRTVEAAKAPQEITFEQPASPAVYNTTFPVSATSDSGLAVSIEASGACTRSGPLVRMTSGTGTCALTARQAGDGNYQPAADVVRTVAAAKASQAITFAQPPSPAKNGSSFTVSPAASSGLAVALAAEGSCTVSGFTVTMTADSGACTLTASQPGDANYSAASPVSRAVQAIPGMQYIFLPLTMR